VATRNVGANGGSPGNRDCRESWTEGMEYSKKRKREEVSPVPPSFFILSPKEVAVLQGNQPEPKPNKSIPGRIEPVVILLILLFF
jgi:hypothetical protein